MVAGDPSVSPLCGSGMSPSRGLAGMTSYWKGRLSGPTSRCQQHRAGQPQFAVGPGMGGEGRCEFRDKRLPGGLVDLLLIEQAARRPDPAGQFRLVLRRAADDVEPGRCDRDIAEPGGFED